LLKLRLQNKIGVILYKLRVICAHNLKNKEYKNKIIVLRVLIFSPILDKTLASRG